MWEIELLLMYIWIKLFSMNIEILTNCVLGYIILICFCVIIHVFEKNKKKMKIRKYNDVNNI